MSKLDEMIAQEEARAEADEADATEPDPDDTPDDDTPDDDTPDDTPSEPAPDEAAEAAYKKIEQAAGRYGAAVGKALEGVELDIQPCPLCVTPGLVHPFQSGTSESAEAQQRVFTYFGASEPDYKRAENTAACAACDGLGQVLTGAKNDVNRLKLCDVCGGTGWTTTGAIVAPIGGLSPAANGAQFTPSSTEMTLPPDAWGRPAGHRFYGQVPGTEV